MDNAINFLCPEDPSLNTQIKTEPGLEVATDMTQVSLGNRNSEQSQMQVEHNAIGGGHSMQYQDSIKTKPAVMDHNTVWEGQGHMDTASDEELDIQIKNEYLKAQVLIKRQIDEQTGKTAVSPEMPHKRTRKSTGTTVHACSYCGKTYPKPSKLEKHIRSHTGERPFPCTFCDSAFADSSTLKKHVRIHTGEKPFQCKICGRTFTQAGNLNEHVKTHTGERPHECKDCGKRFTESSTLRKHLRVHTGERPYQCSHCGRAFRQSSTLKDHISSHTGEKRYVCKECGKAFARKNNLNEHMRSHAGIKPYQCTLCDRTFSRRTHQLSHLRSHTGEKPYKCKFCEEHFKHIASLRKHEQAHIGEKLYKCTLCERQFTQATSLKGHMSIHTGEKAYQCRHCDKKFARYGQRKKHEKIHTGNDLNKCEFCDEIFEKRNHLQRHLKLHVGDEYTKLKDGDDPCYEKKSRTVDFFSAVDSEGPVSGKHDLIPSTGNVDMRSDELPPDVNQIMQASMTTRCGGAEILGSGQTLISVENVSNEETYGQLTLNHTQKLNTTKKTFRCGVCFRNFVKQKHMIAHKLLHVGIARENVKEESYDGLQQRKPVLGECQPSGFGNGSENILLTTAGTKNENEMETSVGGISAEIGMPVVTTKILSRKSPTEKTETSTTENSVYQRNRVAHAKSNASNSTRNCAFLKMLSLWKAN